MDRLEALFETWSGEKPAHITPLAGAGSNRRYYRLEGAKAGKSCTLIGVIGEHHDENRAFIYLSRHFFEQGLPVPEVVSVSDDGLCYLQTDLGDMSLYKAIILGREAGGVYNVHEKELLCRAIRLLPRIQVLGARDLDVSQCYPVKMFDMTSVRFDLNYFKYCFLLSSGCAYDEMRLEADFEAFAQWLVGDGLFDTFLYRDFQSRNVMLVNDEPYLIDFQGGRLGPVEYDVASFLWQSSAQMPPDLRQWLVGEYFEALNTLRPTDRAVFDERLPKFVLFRTLQVLGAYGFRGYVERKAYFLGSIEGAVKNLSELLDAGVCQPFPYLEHTLKKIVSRHEKQPQTVKEEPQELVVRVFSFSYKKGIPEDVSGNGGGYVFDCRSIHNPGKYEEYKPLTGLDRPVIDFLESDGEITAFLAHVYPLAVQHVERYRERGFKHLMFSFGCTGGRHRSVYCAEHLADYLHRECGVRVELCHREREMCRTLG